MKSFIFLILISFPIYVSAEFEHALGFDKEFDNNNRYQQPQRSYGYESNLRTRYKYDLSNPSDRIDYRLDPGAQIMDSINPDVKMDRRSGHYGGGAEW